jgi:exodeoxyribonuclease V gamma subunit
MISTDPLDQPPVIVPNPQMRKWLQLEHARRTGASAGLRFYMNEAGLSQLLHPSRVIAGMEERQVALYLLLIHDKSQDIQFLRNYCQDEQGQLLPTRTWELAGELSRYFSSYELYRPELMEDLSGYSSLTPLEAAELDLYGKSLSLLHDSGFQVTGELLDPEFPEQEPGTIIFFGLSHYPPLLIRSIYRLSQKANIYIYMLNPCNEFWEDIESSHTERWKKINAIPLREDNTLEDPETGDNSLLKLWGRAGRETIKLFSLLEDALAPDLQFETSPLVEDAKSQETFLSQIQRHVFNRINPEPHSLVPDESLQILGLKDIHDEIEWIHESILKNLMDDSSLAPSDIAIMVPEMERYAPVIQEVFERHPDNIPYSLIDAGSVIQDEPTSSFRKILDIISRGLTRSSVFDLLSLEVIHSGFNLTEEDIRELHQLFTELNCDTGGFRKIINRSRTWNYAGSRIRLNAIIEPILGMETYVADFHGQLTGHISKTPGRDTLSSFFLFIEELLSLENRILDTESLPVREWKKILFGILRTFLGSAREEEYRNLQGNLSNALESLASITSALDKNIPLNLETLRRFINSRLTGSSGTRGRYLTSGVNISALVPNRPFPFRLIYIAGMEEGPFPSVDVPSSLNLMSQHRKPGERSRYEFETYLFLEHLVTARERLYLTYVCHDASRDIEQHPNSIIAHLRSYLGKIVKTKDAGGNDLLDRKDITREPQIIISRIQAGTDKEGRLPAPSWEGNSAREDSISIYALKRFLDNPGHYYLMDRGPLQMIEEEEIPDQETLLDEYISPGKYKLWKHLFERIMRESDDFSLRDLPLLVQEEIELALLTGDIALTSLTEFEKRILETKMEDYLKKTGLLSFLRSSGNSTYTGTLALGESPGRILPPVCSREPARLPGKERPVITGTLNHIWKGEETRFLIHTNSRTIFLNRLITPFLLHALSLQKENRHLLEFTSGPVSVFYTKQDGGKYYTFDISEEEARDFLITLAREMENLDEYMYLPLSPVVNQKELREYILKDEKDADSFEFLDMLTRHVNKQSHSGRLKSYSLEEIISRKLPEDSFEKCRLLLLPFLKSLTERNNG